MEDRFEANGWGDTWRDGIYHCVHYHSRINEVLGIARGKGPVCFGGNKGRIFTLKAGDVAVLPAGTGHPHACPPTMTFLSSAPTRRRGRTTSARPSRIGDVR